MPSNDLKTLYLIDGYAQFFRAYHAIRTPMTSPVTGEPTNLTFGFVGMLLKLLRGAPAGASLVGDGPDYLAVAIDVSGDTETVRSAIDKDYKAQRPPPPEDLPQQVERCLSILKAIGVPVLGMARSEADAVIAARGEIVRRYEAVKAMAPSGSKTRIHGDYHLGQVIVAQSDLVNYD